MQKFLDNNWNTFGDFAFATTVAPGTAGTEAAKAFRVIDLVELFVKRKRHTMYVFPSDSDSSSRVEDVSTKYVFVLAVRGWN